MAQIGSDPAKAAESRVEYERLMARFGRLPW
jgi:hypothetical protein